MPVNFAADANVALQAKSGAVMMSCSQKNSCQDAVVVRRNNNKKPSDVAAAAGCWLLAPVHLGDQS